MVDTLYAQLNNRGRKQHKPLEKQTFIEHFGEYANLGLPAHKAALDGNVECLKECFCSFPKEGGLGVPSRDVNGATPLHLAARNNHADAIKWLLRFTDLSPDVTAKHGETPAHVAAAQGHYESLKQLLAADGKGDIKSKLATAVDNSGFTILHLAIVKNRNDCAKLLISELGSKAVNALNESGVTAVHLAASAGNVEVLRFLSTKHKKLLYQKDKEGASPVYYAAQEGRLEVLKFMSEKCKCALDDACGDGLKPIHAASQCGHTNIIKYIVSRLGSQAILDTTPDDATPLHFCTSTGKIHTAQWIISNDLGGTLVSKKDKNGDTPAHDAAESGHVPMLKLLLENGADLYAINNDGNTPYSFALSGGNMDTANFVMTYASKSPQKDSGGPVRIYNRKGEVDVVDVNKISEVSQPDNKSKKSSMKGNEPKTSNSFIGNTSKSFQSFNNGSNPEDDGDAELDMTEEEFAMFGSDQAHNDGSHHGDEDLVVRYSESQAINPMMSPDEPAEPGYATINEITLQEEKREKKLGRKISKSIQKAIGPAKVKEGNKVNVRRLSGEMGFKPQFHSNPLMKLGGSIPPAPPPTPATATSIAPSDEASHSLLADVDEVDYDPYATPDLKVIQQKAEQRRYEQVNRLKNSENQKLLKDALEDLSGEDSPPEIPKKMFGPGENTNVPSRVSVESQEHSQTGGSENSLDASKTKSFNERLDRTSSGSKFGSKVTTSETEEKSRFPVLKPVKQIIPPKDGSNTELSKIKLRRAADWKRAEYSHPEKETTSGASDELKNILKKKIIN